MSQLVAEEIERYAQEHTTPPPDFLAQLADETRATLPIPQMLTGTVEGRLLELLVHATRATRVLEIGTYSGYSALSMAAALGSGGTIVTCEIDPERAAFARRHFEASPYADRIDLRVGPALETIRGLEGPLDLVFIDADKSNYANYYEAVLPLLSDHGLIAVDNTLWGGTVLDESDGSEDTLAIKAFNEALPHDRRVTCVLLTVRDGVTLIRKNG
jgi:caffeoyl-CoA O-methyltransferase